MYYFQCVLQKGSKRDVAWIPQQYALPGKILRIGHDNGWRVTKVFSVPLEYTEDNKNSRDWLRTRKVSDI